MVEETVEQFSWKRAAILLEALQTRKSFREPEPLLNILFSLLARYSIFSLWDHKRELMYGNQSIGNVNTSVHIIAVSMSSVLGMESHHKTQHTCTCIYSQHDV